MGFRAFQKSGVGFIMAGFTERKQAQHDKLIGTMVVVEFMVPDISLFT